MNSVRTFILSLPIVLSCCINEPTETGNELLIVNSTESQLNIVNRANIALYLFIVEGEHATLINWAPGFNGLHIERKGSIVVKLKDISNGTSEPVKKGDKIIVYYWNDVNKDKPDVKLVIVEL